MEAIILARRDFREYDQIISAYTKERGKIELLARGVKKITSKNAAHVEPFSYVMADWVRGKQLDHLTRVVPIDYFSAIRQDLDKNRAAGFVVGVTDRLLEPGEPDKKIFDLMKSWLRFVERAEVMAPLLVDGYMATLLHCFGFTPILEQCVGCTKSFSAIVQTNFLHKEKKPAFYFAGGGIVCDDCRRKKEVIGEEMAVCGLKEISDWQLVLKGDWRLIHAYQMTLEEYQLLHKLMYEFATYHCERKIGDWGSPSRFFPSTI